MNNTNITKNNFLKVISNFAKDNLKTIIISLLIIFLIFLIYQGYSYYEKNKLNKLSISYFEIKEEKKYLRGFQAPESSEASRQKKKTFPF